MQTQHARRHGSHPTAIPRRSRLLRRLAPALAGLVALGSLGCGGLEVKHINSAEKKPNNVWVFFTVKDGEEPVGGLSADDFEIYEDGKIVSKFESKQIIQNPEVAAVMYTLLLVDMSGSITESDQVGPLVDAAKRFATKVGKTQKVGVYAFDGSDKLEKIVGFTESEGSVESGLERLRTYKSKDPSTNLHGAVIKGLDELEKELEKDSRPLKFGTLVTFTDGADRAARYTQDQMLEAMGQEKYANYEKLSIGVGADIEEGDLSAVGPNGSERADDQKKLGEAFDKIADRIDRHMKRFYLLSYCTPARAGEHQVTIKAKDPRTESSGSLDYSFKADGFGPPPDCDPKTKPSFDLKASVKEDGKSGGGSPGSVKVQGSGSVGK
jgi:hypothetical protein